MLGLEKKLRELEVWEKFNHNFTHQNEEISLNEYAKLWDVEDTIIPEECFAFNETKEGQDFWDDINKKCLL